MTRDSTANRKTTVDPKAKSASLKIRLKDADDPISVLENAFSNYTVLVVSAGPSSNQWANLYKDLIKTEDKLLIACVKQSIDLVGDKCRIHFLNSGNLRRYSSADECISIFTRNSKYDPAPGKYDITFNIMENLNKERFYLARTSLFSSYQLSVTGEYRPPGPGIMHETVFYTLAHMGVSKIITIGWDIADEEGRNTHFNAQHVSHNRTVVTRKSKLRILLEKFNLWKTAKFIKYISVAALEYPKFLIGKPINRSVMFHGEADLISGSLPALKSWLSSINIELEIFSSSQWHTKASDSETKNHY